MKKRYLALCAAFALAASGASATSFNWSASIDGLQETPPNASPATGSATGTFDDVTNLLTWSGSFSGLTANTSDAHFHGPSPLGGAAAGVQVPMTAAGGGDVFPLGVTSGSFNGTATLTAAQETMFLDELLYINIHSVGTFAAGEIRGQVLVPEPSTLALLALGFAGLAWTGRRRA
jgi:hypothetical protein